MGAEGGRWVTREDVIALVDWVEVNPFGFKKDS